MRRARRSGRRGGAGGHAGRGEAAQGEGLGRQAPKELKPLRGRVAEGLVARGVLAEEQRKILGIFGSTRYPEADPEHERRLRDEICEVLVTGREPSQREAMLVGLLHAYDLVKRVVPREDRRDAKRRAKELAKGDAIAGAVGSAVSDVQAATMAAVIAATSAATVSSGDGGGGGGGGTDADYFSPGTLRIAASRSSGVPGSGRWSPGSCCRWR